jgi:hypothetical protein
MDEATHRDPVPSVGPAGAGVKGATAAPSSTCVPAVPVPLPPDRSCDRPSVTGSRWTRPCANGGLEK